MLFRLSFVVLALFASGCWEPEVEKAECHIPRSEYTVAMTKVKFVKYIGVRHRSIQLLRNNQPIVARALPADFDEFGKVGVVQTSANQVVIQAGLDTTFIDLKRGTMRTTLAQFVFGHVLGVFEHDRDGMLMFTWAPGAEAVVPVATGGQWIVAGAADSPPQDRDDQPDRYQQPPPPPPRNPQDRTIPPPQPF